MSYYMYAINNFVKIFDDELTNWLIDESGFKQSQCIMSIYYKYTPDVSKSVVLSYIDDCVYWYTYYELGKSFVDTLLKILHVKFLEYAHWFISISISPLKDHYSAVDQSSYNTSVLKNICTLSQ